MLSAANIGLNGQGIGSDLVMNIMDDFVVDDPLECFNIIEHYLLQMSSVLEVIFDFGITNLGELSSVGSLIQHV